MKILKDFYEQYCDFSIDLEDTKEVEIQVHTLKGLSASIGASSLNDITKRIENAPKDEELIKLLSIELNLVTSELLPLLQSNKEEEQEELLAISTTEVKTLFLTLKESLQAHRPTAISSLLQEITRYALPSKEQEVFNKVLKLAHNYEYQKAEKLL